MNLIGIQSCHTAFVSSNCANVFLGGSIRIGGLASYSRQDSACSSDQSFYPKILALLSATFDACFCCKNKNIKYQSRSGNGISSLLYRAREGEFPQATLIPIRPFGRSQRDTLKAHCFFRGRNDVFQNMKSYSSLE